MKNLKLITIFLLIFCSSCSNKQTKLEKEIFTQLGDSCIYKISDFIKTQLNTIKFPPPPPDIVLTFYTDTLNGKKSLNKYDTLAYPFRFSVLEFNSKVDTSILKDYYKAFSAQNAIRIKYIYENIIINDSLYIPTSGLIEELFKNYSDLAVEFSLTTVGTLMQKYFPFSSNEISWDTFEQKKNITIINDLKPSTVKFYRIIFNENNTKGILILKMDIKGFINIFGFFEIENNDKNWSIKRLNLISYKKNDKRWKIQ
jgi:hypothetical protein